MYYEKQKHGYGSEADFYYFDGYVLCCRRLCDVVSAGLDKKALVGKWYQMNIEENTYDRTEYFEFFADDTFQTGSGEVGSFDIENHNITFRIDDMGTLTLPYKIKYEGRTPKALELTGKKGTTTFINENAVR